MYNTQNGVSDGRTVTVPGDGHNYHLTSDCYGINLGQTFHGVAGGEIKMSVGDAIAEGKFACRICYRKAGIEIPAEADRVKVRAAKRAERMARKADKVAATEVVATDPSLAELTAQIGAVMLMLRDLVTARNALVA
jgi:hypothetical protein